ncbi:hypothetical protein TWF481_006426 [Arthrobotrys musiformis]|uniref:Uncharacterized protein n=1 Tax=Arthrobotrys musiformis TaxID=47236 RepID=A0AAV9WIN4_9PEZI
MKATFIAITVAAAIAQFISAELTDPTNSPSNHSGRAIVYTLTEAQAARAQARVDMLSSVPHTKVNTEEISKLMEGGTSPLKGFEGCTEDQKYFIFQAFLQVRKIFEPVVKRWKDYPIDWTSAAALEFFGPPVDTRKYRKTVRCKFKASCESFRWKLYA